MIPFVMSLAAEAADFDHSHAAFAAVLQGAVTDRGVNYATLAGRKAQLESYLAGVATADPSAFTPTQKLAFYVNAYNAYTIKTMLESGPPGSIMDLDGGKVWDVRKFKVANADITLNTMENGNARKLTDGRVHSVLNCASRGCPPLYTTPLVADKAGAQLDEGARRWARTNAYRIDGTTLYLSKIFDWYGDDFTKENKGDLPGLDGKGENAAWFLVKYVDAATAAQLQGGTLTVAWQDYDWSLNKQ
jgi:hypothetical protein